MKGAEPAGFAVPLGDAELVDAALAHVFARQEVRARLVYGEFHKSALVPVARMLVAELARRKCIG